MKLSKFVFTVAVLLFGSAFVNLRAAEVKCDIGDYRGIYAFHTVGSLVHLPPQGAFLQGPFAQAGTFTSDGQGNLIIESNASYNGIVLPANVPATYTVSPECVFTVSLVLPDPLGVPSTFVGVLSAGGRQTNLTITDPPGTVVIGEHFKQDLRFCGTQDFSGAYQVDLGGGVADPIALGGQPAPPAVGPAGPFRRVGRLVADGHGKFTAKTIANYSGQIVEEDFDGNYNVNARCAITFSFNYNGIDQTWNGALGGHGERAVLMVVSPDWAVSGELRAQQ